MPAGIASVSSRARPCCTSTRIDVDRSTTLLRRGRSTERHARAEAQRLFGAAIVDLALPRKRQRLVGAAERGPAAFGRRLGSLADEAAGDRQIDAAARQRQGGARDRRRRTTAARSIRCRPMRPAARDLERQHRRGPRATASTCAGGPSIERHAAGRRGARRAPSGPAGIGTFTQPSRSTSTVSSTRPAIASPPAPSEVEGSTAGRSRRA